MTDTLKPCPFCGGPAEFVQIGDTRQSCIVACTECGASHESSDEGFGNGRSWNRRAGSEQAKDEEMEQK